MRSQRLALVTREEKVRGETYVGVEREKREKEGYG